jgi:glycine cleavage system H protein
MSEVKQGLRYTETHEWIEEKTGNVKMGISDFAQRELGDVVFLDLPEPGRTFKAGDSLATVESVKAVSDIYAPVDCTVVARNEDLAAAPEVLNADPFGKGWLIEITVGSPTQLESLHSASAYSEFISKLEK